MSWPARKRDPVRAFDANQRRAAKLWCGNRCEFDAPVLFWCRCSKPAEHADHFIPWSSGGATSMRNLVMACAGHNLSKSAKIPSRFQAARIARRRRKYFPASMPLMPGERYE